MHEQRLTGGAKFEDNGGSRTHRAMGTSTPPTADDRRAYSCSQHLTTPPGGSGGVGSGFVCKTRSRARAHKRTRRQTTRRWALAQRRHVSFEAIGRGTPSREHAGPAVRRICARRAVGTFIGHRQRSRLHLSGAREVPLALVVGEPHNDDSRVILSRRRVVGQHWSTGTSGVLASDCAGGDR